MSNPNVLNLFAASVLLASSSFTNGQALPPWAAASDTAGYAPGEVIVQFKPTVDDAQLNNAFQQAHLSLLAHVRTPAMQDHGLIGLTRAATAMPVEAAVRVLSQLPGVDFAEPNWLVIPQAVSDDPHYLGGWLWGLESASADNPSGTQADAAWAAGFTGSSDVYVGVLDGGIQVDHEDLAANIWTNPGEIPGNGIDDDGDGYVDDVHG